MAEKGLDPNLVRAGGIAAASPAFRAMTMTTPTTAYMDRALRSDFASNNWMRSYQGPSVTEAEF